MTCHSRILLERRVVLAHKLSPIRWQALLFLNNLQLITIIALYIPCDNLLMILFFECFDYYFPFFGWQMLFEFSFKYDWRPFLQNFNVIFVVLAWGSQRALGAPLFNQHHFGLQVNSCLLQVNEPFLLELTPNLFLHCVLRIDWIIINILLLVLLQVFFLWQGLWICCKRSSWTLFLIISFPWILVGTILLVAVFHFIRRGLLLYLLILLLCWRPISPSTIKYQIVLNVVRSLIEVFNLKLSLWFFGFNREIKWLSSIIVIMGRLKVRRIVFVVALRWISLSWGWHFI
jgi:hypothetical protein